MSRRWKRPGTRDGGWPRSRSGCWRAAAPSRPTGTPTEPWPDPPPGPREMTSPGPATQRARPHAGPAWMVLALACTSQFMVILDASIVNVALPSIQRDLGFTATGLAWVVNGYLLTFAGFMLLSGRAADLFGHRRMLVAGLFLFSASSLVAGLATAPEVLVAARVAQGVGAAMLAPATLAVINTSFTGEHARARAFGAWSASGGVGGMAGAGGGGPAPARRLHRCGGAVRQPADDAPAAVRHPAGGRRQRHAAAVRRDRHRDVVFHVAAPAERTGLQRASGRARADARGGDVRGDRAIGRRPAAANRCAPAGAGRLRLFPGRFRLARPGPRRQRLRHRRARADAAHRGRPPADPSHPHGRGDGRCSRGRRGDRRRPGQHRHSG